MVSSFKKTVSVAGHNTVTISRNRIADDVRPAETSARQQRGHNCKYSNFHKRC